MRNSIDRRDCFLAVVQAARAPTSWLLCGALLAAGCTDRGEPRTQDRDTGRSAVVYGNDDRRDVYEYADQGWAGEVADFTVALMTPDAISVSPGGEVSLVAATLEVVEDVCPDERFANQLAAAFCSGTLIAPDLVLTAGHCVRNAEDCASTRLVFDYYMDGPATPHPVTQEDVFSCTEVLVQADELVGLDYAIVRLDRPTGRTPASLAAASGTMAAGAPLLVQGFPSGLPLKIDDGGRVRDGRASAGDYFVANLDTFGGSSGSGVFSGTTRELVGILVRGEADYVFDDSDGCYRVLRCPDGGCSGEDVTYAFRAVEALCSRDVVTPLCPCGDGVCDPADGETTATCPRDCGSRCGDGACNGPEQPVDCPEDCGICGNQVCDPGESEDTCCTDCSCSAPLVCAANACVPEASDGDTCADVAEIRSRGSYVIPGNTATAAHDYHGECASNTSALDRVYGMTLEEETWVEAQATGFDIVLYVRTNCADAASETLCVDDSSPPGGGGSRLVGLFEPGTHYLFIDGHLAEAGPYELALSFTPVRLVSNDTCAAPVSIPAAGTQVMTASLGPITGRNDYQGSCGGSGADHVYTFTTSVRTEVTAKVEGVDSVLYVRSACAAGDAASELACNDDHPEAGYIGSLVALSDLAPGTYHLIVDSFGTQVTDEYTLTVTFGTCADSDGDGVCNPLDGCASDPAKLEPGQCGCGAADVDRDSDGVADCLDACPDDPGKTNSATCGCGVADSDTDGDGTSDCVDGCIDDPGKIAAGGCGCGVADSDTDGDGTLDCVDACPSDPGKTGPGACGCGNPEGACDPQISGDSGGCGCSAGSAGSLPDGLILLLVMLFMAHMGRRRSVPGRNGHLPAQAHPGQGGNAPSR